MSANSSATHRSVQQRRRLAVRLQARRERRAEGIVIRPATAQWCGDAQHTQLRGYTALKLVFAERPHEDLTAALAATDHLPTTERAAVAARVLMASALNAQTPKATAPPQAPTRFMVLRTSTAGPVLTGRAQPPPTAPTPVSEERMEQVDEDEFLNSLRGALTSQGLEHVVAAAEVWIDRTGACDLNEILDNFEDFADALELGSPAVAKLRGAIAEIVARRKSMSHRPHAEEQASAIRCTAAHVAADTAKGAAGAQRIAKTVSAPAVCYIAAPQLASHQQADEFRPPTRVVVARPPVKVLYRTQSLEMDSLPDGTAESYAEAKRHIAAFEGRRILIRDWSPPKTRCRVHPVVLKARIPTEYELKAKELAQARAAKTDVEEGSGEGAEPAKHDLASFEGLQTAFMCEHGAKLKQELGPSVKLVPAALSSTVQNQFLESVQNSGEVPDFGYHGTARKNFSGIFNQGLRIPGSGGVRVVNGSDHGVGIYTAKPGAAYLSRGFCDSEDMLVCGLVTAKPEMASDQATKPPRMVCQHRNHHKPGANSASSSSAPKMLGRFGVTRDDGIIREVGQARVVFKESYVAPLFIAKGSGKQEAKVYASTPIQFSGLGNVNSKDQSDRSGSRQVVIKESGEHVWMPPEAVRDWNSIRVKRMHEDKRQTQERQKAQSRKEDAQSLAELDEQ